MQDPLSHLQDLGRRPESSPVSAVYPEADTG